MRLLHGLQERLPEKEERLQQIRREGDEEKQDWLWQEHLEELERETEVLQIVRETDEEEEWLWRRMQRWQEEQALEELTGEAPCRALLEEAWEESCKEELDRYGRSRRMRRSDRSGFGQITSRAGWCRRSCRRSGWSACGRSCPSRSACGRGRHGTSGSGTQEQQ